MRIDRLKIVNFKGFEHREFSFHPQMNLLVGENGTGKTSVLDALSVALGAWLLGIKGHYSRPIRSREVRHKAIPVQEASDGSRSEQLNWEDQYPCAIEASGVVTEVPMVWRRELNTPTGKTTYVHARNIKSRAELMDRRVRSGDSALLPLISYYGTGRLWDIPRSPVLKEIDTGRGKKAHSRLFGYENSVDPRVSVAELTRWIAEQSWITYQQGGVTSAYATVRKAMLACIEGAIDMNFDARRGEVIVTLGNNCIQPFDNLSDGQRTLLAMVGDIARKAAILNPHLGDAVLVGTPGVVLIDELDLHLHPVWQRRVIEDLRTIFPEIQFFATTHSPFLIQSLRSGEELVMLDGGPPAELASKSLEDIARGVMGVVDPSVSTRYGEMKHVARSYLETLNAAKLAPEEKLDGFRDRLASAIGPYADNPAFQAFLELKQAATLGD